MIRNRIALVLVLAGAACSRKPAAAPPDWGPVGAHKNTLDFAWMKFQRGDPEGAEFLGAAYQGGLFGLKQDPQKAEEWFVKERALRRK